MVFSIGSKCDKCGKRITTTICPKCGERYKGKFNSKDEPFWDEITQRYVYGCGSSKHPKLGEEMVSTRG